MCGANYTNTTHKIRQKNENPLLPLLLCSSAPPMVHYKSPEILSAKRDHTSAEIYSS